MVRIFFFLFLISPFLGLSQIKGKAKYLVGKWNYKEGSGFEVWNRNGDMLQGSGYRILKFGDSVEVENLTLAFVNGRYSYTYHNIDQDLNKKDITFISKGKKLIFVSTNSETTIHLRYKLNLRKDKLKIYVTVGNVDNRADFI